MKEKVSLSYCLEEGDNSRGAPVHQGTTGFAIQQQLQSKTPLGLVAACFYRQHSWCHYASHSQDQCHHLLATPHVGLGTAGGPKHPVSVCSPYLLLAQDLHLDNANALCHPDRGHPHSLKPERGREKGAGVYVNSLLSYYGCLLYCQAC